MSVSDILVMLIGIVLIGIGLFLFVSGKKEASQNHVEGFGIKLNVSNPSVILIIIGVGLLVLPRFMPDNIDERQSPVRVENNNQPVPIETIQPAPVETLKPVPVEAIQQSQSQDTKPSTAQSTAFPQGSWQLASIQENGIDYMVPMQVNGRLTFSKHTANSVNWNSQVWIVDDYGNEIYDQYSGQIIVRGNIYFISFLQGSSSDFTQELNIPLEFYMEEGGLLHMKYLTEGNVQIVHWQQ
ncbi:hypothetical protein [Thalassotalea atypica]|uniref:hypothetical protein n=1 Tax=Thalassotalea atypica TaxID=2054316 RepID=UPI002572CE45|nr:hypothetical protein [Thalassotalea atypica]